MVRILICIGACCFFIYPATAQDSLSRATDSTHLLNEVLIKAYEYGRPLNEVPVAIGVVGKKDFERFNTTSLLPALNTIPGVRMEERSPGSYRLSIRGSTLRSPFGVRNVKVYWNDLPFTDPGGNTYLNLLDFSSIQQAEIIKGPGASLYGAGTGGVILLKGPQPNFNQDQLQFSTTVGSYGLSRYNLGLQTSSEKASTTIQYAHQQADGYREQSRMTRDVFQAQGKFQVDAKRTISGNIFYADLYYQTPGALTKSQYDKNPQLSRPTIINKDSTKTGIKYDTTQSAIAAHAAVYNKTFYSALSQEYVWNSHWSNRSGVYSTFTQFKNPTVGNYERKTEQSFGGRTNTQYATQHLKVNFGGEFQRGFSPDKTHDNNKGAVGNIQTDDEISSTSALLFAQGDLILPRNFFLTLGGSYSFFKIDFTHLSLNQGIDVSRNFNPVFSPRIALLKKITNAVSIYGSVSQGFSNPTVAELYPSTAVFDTKLNPEQGKNYEAGIRGNLFKNIITFDVTAYDFELKNAIVSRQDATKVGNPGYYFVNAGNTSQKGLEVNVSWAPKLNTKSFISDWRLWTSGTFNHYRFKDYMKNSVSYSGNRLTGVAPNIVVIGLDVNSRMGIYLNVTFNFTDRIPLNDGNAAFANSYKLLTCKGGYRFKISKNFPVEVFGGVDNALDERYSLGNDLNAAGGRFYNAAAPRNFFGGLKSNMVLKKRS